MIMDYKLDETVFTEECGSIDMDRYLTRASNKTKILVVETIEEFNKNENSLLLVGDDGVDESKLVDFGMTKIFIKDKKFSLYFRGFYAITKTVEGFYFIDSPTKLTNLCRYIFKTMKYSIPSLIDATMVQVVISNDLIERIGLKSYPSTDEKSMMMRYVNRRLAFNRETKRLEKIIALIRIQGELMYITASEPNRYDNATKKDVPFLLYLTAFEKNPITDIEFLAIRESTEPSDWTNISLVHISERWDAEYAISRLTVEFDLTGIGPTLEHMRHAILTRKQPYAEQIYYDILCKSYHGHEEIGFNIRVPSLIKCYVNTKLAPLSAK